MKNFNELASQVPEAIRRKIDPKYSDDEIIVEVIDDKDETKEDQPKEDIPQIFEWAKQRNKRQKMVEVLEKAQQKALQILPRGSKYFDDIKRRLLVSQA